MSSKSKDTSSKDAAGPKAAQLSQDNDIVDLILTDHVTVKEAFQKLKAGGGKGKQQEKGASDELEQIYQKMCWDIAEHAAAEELVFYPLLEKGLGKEGQKVTAESREDHEKTKKAMGEIDGLPFSEAEAKATQMVEELIEHMNKEETEDLVMTREKFDTNQRKEAAQLFKKAKMFAPKSGKPTDGKQPYETPFALMMAATEELKKAFDKALPTEGQNGDQEEGDGKRYNLRSNDGDAEGKQGDDQKSGPKTSPSGDKQQGRRSGDGESGKNAKNVTSPAKNGSHDKNGSQKNGSPGKEAGDDAVPPAKRGAEGDDHKRKKGAAADRGEEEVAANE